MRLIQLSVLLACIAVPAAAEWQLHKLSGDHAGTSESVDNYVLHINCARNDDNLRLELYPVGMDRSDTAGLSGVTIDIAMPDGGVERASVNLNPNRDGFEGSFPVRPDWLAAFKDGRQMTISRGDTGRQLLRSDMKGTGAARILFAERCGV